jgi:hypothetical protein
MQEEEECTFNNKDRLRKYSELLYGKYNLSIISQDSAQKRSYK